MDTDSASRPRTKGRTTHPRYAEICRPAMRAARLLSKGAERCQEVERFRFLLSDDLSAVPSVVDDILHATLSGMDRRTLLDVRLGLLELTVNAVEHGILAISSAEKSEALMRGCYDEVVAARRKRNKKLARGATVQIERTADSVVFDVVDDGEGFDWRNRPDPTNTACVLLAEWGRGIHLAAQIFDGLFYNDIGNWATAVKYYCFSRSAVTLSLGR